MKERVGSIFGSSNPEMDVNPLLWLYGDGLLDLDTKLKGEELPHCGTA
jgi:hypothetical protein